MDLIMLLIIPSIDKGLDWPFVDYYDVVLSRIHLTLNMLQHLRVGFTSSTITCYQLFDGSNVDTSIC